MAKKKPAAKKEVSKKETSKKKPPKKISRMNAVRKQRRKDLRLNKGYFTGWGGPCGPPDG